MIDATTKETVAAALKNRIVEYKRDHNLSPLPVWQDGWEDGFASARLPHEGDVDTLADEIHEARVFQYGSCDHGTYAGGPFDGEPYQMCELAAQHILDHRSSAGLMVVTDDMVERGAKATFLDLVDIMPFVTVDISKVDWWETQVADKTKNYWRDRTRAALAAALGES